MAGRFVLVVLGATRDGWNLAGHGYMTEEHASADVDRLVAAGDVPMDSLFVCIDAASLEVLWTQRALRVASQN